MWAILSGPDQGGLVSYETPSLGAPNTPEITMSKCNKPKLNGGDR